MGAYAIGMSTSWAMAAKKALTILSILLLSAAALCLAAVCLGKDASGIGPLSAYATIALFFGIGPLAILCLLGEMIALVVKLVARRPLDRRHIARIFLLAAAIIVAGAAICIFYAGMGPMSCIPRTKPTSLGGAAHA